MAILKKTTISDADSLKLPTGSTGDRPGSSNNGDLRFNTDTSRVEFYQDNNAWKKLPLPNQAITFIGASVPLITSGSVDDSSSFTNRSVFNSSPKFSKGNFSFSSSGVTVTQGGYYECYVTCFFNSSGERLNTGVKFTINGSQRSAQSRSAYNRNTTDDKGGTSLSEILRLEAGDEVGLAFAQFSRENGSHTLIADSSNFFIRKVDPPVYQGTFVNDGTVNDFTSFTRLNVFDNNPELTSHNFNVTSAGITVNQPDIYEIYVNLCYNNGTTRDNPAFRLYLNGTALEYTSASAYMRDANGHQESSSNMKILQKLDTGDEIGIGFQEQGDGGTVDLEGAISHIFIKGTNTWQI